MTTTPLLDRLLARSEFRGCCWVWTGALYRDGYGRLMTGSRTDGSRRNKRVHRVSYELFVGPIPDGLELDHLCRVRSCWNPLHLEAVPHPANVQRGEVGQHNARKTHCPRGHLYPPRQGKQRRCRECENAARRAT